MNKKMVSVDFWNTLVKADSNADKRAQARMNAVRDLARYHGMKLTDEAIRHSREQLSRAFDEEWFGRQRTQTTEYLAREMIRLLAIPASPKEIDELADFFRESLFLGPPEPAEGIKEALETLSNYYHLSIISDTMFSPGSVIRKYLDHLEVLSFFDAFAFSDELGVSKPHSKAYETVLNATGARPERSWHVGDMLKTDIKGARAVGMKCILYTGFSDQDTSRDNNNHNNGSPEADFECKTWDAVADILISELR